MKAFTPLFQAFIAFCAFFSVQFALVAFLLNAKIDPVKETIAKLEKRMDGLETGQAKLEKRMDGLETGQAKLSENIAEIKQLLAKR